MSNLTSNKRFRVLLLDTKSQNPNHYICLSIAEALKENAEVESVYKVTLGNAISVARQYDCNLFFAFDGEELHREICDRLRTICGCSVLWVTEDPYELPVNLRNAELFDLVFTNDSGSVGAYGDKGIHLPLAACKDIQYHPVIPDEQCRYDLFFAGTAWPNRVDLIRRLASELAGLKTKIALSTNPHIPAVELDMAPSAYAWRTPNSEFARLANLSRAVLGLHRDYSTSPGAPTVAATPGPRIFEVAMAGGFQLADGSLPEIGRYFRVDKEIVTYSDAEDCVRKLRHFLNHPEQRLAIARAAQARVLAEHTYHHRVQHVMDALRIHAQRPVSSQQPLPGKPRILMVTHNMMGKGSWGGVEVYQDWIRRSLSSRYEIWFYAAVAGSGGRQYALLNEQLEEIERLKFDHPVDNVVLSCQQREREFSKILLEKQIAIVHFQHLLGHVPSLPLIARTLGVPTIISLHDYYAVCDHFTLVGMTGQYCGVENQTESGCDLCLGHTLNARPGSQARRRGFYRRVLESATVLHANTLGVQRRYESVYGSLRRHTGWAVMGVPIADPKPHLADTSAESHFLRVVVPGNFTAFKGGRILTQVFRQLEGAPIKFTLLGRVDTEFSKKLLGPEFTNVHIHGAYNQRDIDDILQGFDVSIHASIWPETYCLTLSEAWRAGIVPVVTDIGALGERVQDGVNGFTFPVESPGRLTEILLQLANDREIVKRIRVACAEKDVAYESTHLSWLNSIYARLSAQAIRASGEAINVSDTLSLSDCGVLLNQTDWLFRYPELENEIAAEPATLSRALRLAMRMIRFAGQNGLKATASKIYEVILRRTNR